MFSRCERDLPIYAPANAEFAQMLIAGGYNTAVEYW